MSDVLSRKAMLEWLDVEIDLSSGNDPVLKADRWAFRYVKKAIESGRFDVSDNNTKDAMEVREDARK